LPFGPQAGLLHQKPCPIRHVDDGVALGVDEVAGKPLAGLGAAQTAGHAHRLDDGEIGRERIFARLLDIAGEIDGPELDSSTEADGRSFRANCFWSARTDLPGDRIRRLAGCRQIADEWQGNAAGRADRVVAADDRPVADRPIRCLPFSHADGEFVHHPKR
jgi:hypothetical protein